MSWRARLVTSRSRFSLSMVIPSCSVEESEPKDGSPMFSIARAASWTNASACGTAPHTPAEAIAGDTRRSLNSEEWEAEREKGGPQAR